MNSFLSVLLFSSWAAFVAAAGTALSSHSAAIFKSDVVSNDANEHSFTERVLTAAPVLKDDAVAGFLIMNLSVKLGVPTYEKKTTTEWWIRDTYFEQVFSMSEAFDVTDMQTFPFEQFKKDFRQKMNLNIGRDVVEDVYLSDVNFVPKSEIRTKSKLKTLTIKSNDVL